jgi:galacturan 1,4-alpha-galacturonidase
MLFKLTLHLLLCLSKPIRGAMIKTGSACIVTPLSTNPSDTTDDTPQILSAFTQCGKEGSITLQPGTYHIGKILDVTNLRNCDISIYGTLIWSTNIQYWLSNSLSVTYAGRSTAWRLGGTNITMRGYGKAVFDGNGQTWYDQNKNAGNQNGRPISLTIWKAENVLIDGITWRQSQFWSVMA